MSAPSFVQKLHFSVVPAVIKTFEPKGAFYAFPEIKSTGMTGDEFAMALLKEHAVAVIPGAAFGPGGEGYIRCCYATSFEEVAEALERIERFIKSRK